MSSDSLSAEGWIDVTLPVAVGMPRWPGDPEVEIERVSDMGRGDSCNVSKLTLCAHTGTHIDAPLHYLSDGVGTEAAPLDALMGRARVLVCDDPVSVRRCWLEKQGIVEGERIIVKTHGSAAAAGQAFREDYVYVAADAAQFLAERKTRLLGINTMSVGGFYDSMVETHKILLGVDCWIVENLDLSQVDAGEWEIICLPMKIADCDGAPARVLMRRV